MTQTIASQERLLGNDDVAPVGTERLEGVSPFVLICDHAGNSLPARLGRLGLPEIEIARHIAWDHGILGLSRALSEQLDAALIYQRYSRLVIDCNRPPRSDLAIPTSSDGTWIPGNVELSEHERARRIEEVFVPYHAAIDSLLNRRAAAGRETVLLSMHSFTPRLRASDNARPWHMSVLFNRDKGFALALARALMQQGNLIIGVNEPYAVEDASDYAIPVHGERRELPHALLEIRQDLIGTVEEQVSWAEYLARVLRHLAVARPTD